MQGMLYVAMNQDETRTITILTWFNKLLQTLKKHTHAHTSTATSNTDNIIVSKTTHSQC